MHRPIEGARPTNLPALDAVGVHDTDFTHIPYADEGCDAVIEKDLSLIPDEVVQGIPKAGEDELAVRVENLRIRGTSLPFSSDVRDPVSLNDYLNISNRRTAVTVDKNASIDYENRRLGSLCESARSQVDWSRSKHKSEKDEQRRSQSAHVVSFSTNRGLPG
jgi:hypothetical protein